MTPPSITFLGSGGAFAPIGRGHSSMLLQSNEHRLLIDCGGSVQFTLGQDHGLNPGDIDGIWISHLHADHIGSMEWFALYRHFLPNKSPDGSEIKPMLLTGPGIKDLLWNSSLRGGLEYLENKKMRLDDYFNCVELGLEKFILWQGLRLYPFRTYHMRQDDGAYVPSFGVYIINTETGRSTLVTTDTSFQPALFSNAYEASDQIFHDCETLDTKSGVHAHYDELKTLPLEIKRKMRLYHHWNTRKDWGMEGFAGFVGTGDGYLL